MTGGVFLVDFRDHIYSVLLISASENFNTSLKKYLPDNRYSPLVIAKDVARAKRLLLERTFDIVIINVPLPDDFGINLALDICEKTGTGVLLFVKSDFYSDISAKVSPYGAMVVQKPTNGETVTQSMLVICGIRERIRRMEEKTASFEEKMEEIRLVNRAKWLLIEELKMTEAEAHRYIEKHAMDRCVTRRKIAENIISTYK